MIQSLKMILTLFVFLVIASNPGRLKADAPEIVTPNSTGQTVLDPGVQDRLQQAGHQNSTKIQPVNCTVDSGNGCKKCGSCNKKKCKKCKKCKGCKVCRPSLFDRIKWSFARGKCKVSDRFGGTGNGIGTTRFLPKRMIPNGCGGKGCPPFGRYQMVYPADPTYFDRRDASVHAAQGYNVPMTVPLAPVVRHQYNYSWGVPASRLTPISNYAPTGTQGYGYPNQMPNGYCPSCQPGVNY